MTHQIVGYIRVSSPDQNPDRQLIDIELDMKFIDKVTGSNLDRAKLQECIAYVRKGDTLVIASIDRLARNLCDLQDVLITLINKGVIVKFIKENLTFSGNDDAMSILMLQMMGAFAEFEHSMIRSRQREGIDAAKKLGKHLGRPPTITPQLSREANLLKKEGVSIRQIAIRLKVCRATVYKMICN